MSGYKVEICGVNTAKLPLLSNEEKEELASGIFLSINSLGLQQVRPTILSFT